MKALDLLLQFQFNATGTEIRFVVQAIDQIESCVRVLVAMDRKLLIMNRERMNFTRDSVHCPPTHRREISKHKH